MRLLHDVCVPDCVPNCAGRQCGDNGCGGSCGACSSGTCNSNGQCVISCTDECSPAGPVCISPQDSRVCGNYDGDNCLEWSPTTQCSPGWSCNQATGYCQPSSASLSASYTITSTQQQGVYTYYYYDVTISESNGVGVNINSGQGCFQSIGCKSPQTTSFRIPGGGSERRSTYFVSSYHPDRLDYTYFGTDDNGNSRSVSFSIPVS